MGGVSYDDLDSLFEHQYTKGAFFLCKQKITICKKGGDSPLLKGAEGGR